jgi:hypothetical protein
MKGGSRQVSKRLEEILPGKNDMHRSAFPRSFVLQTRIMAPGSVLGSERGAAALLL